MNRYKELVYQSKSYTETYKINEILIKNGFDWFLDCEVENCRIEILKNTLVFNSGVFFNGTWVYGVFRDGQWKYGTWEGGVWYNGTWYNGIFKNGIIFDGRFIAGKIEGGEIRGGEFFDCEIGKSVAKSITQENKNSPKPQQGQPQGQPANRGQMQKVQGQDEPQPVQEQSPMVQPQKIEERVKRFDTFIKKKLKDMNNLKSFSEINEGFFREAGKKIKDFFTEKPGADDELGEKIINYLNNHDDVNINYQKRNDPYYGYKIYWEFVIRGGGNENDQLGEEIWEDDLNVKVIEDIGFEEYFVKVVINQEDELQLHSKIGYTLTDILKKKYEENLKLERNNKINKYKDLL